MAYALVTGGSKGIGKAIAEELALHGFDILIIARSAELLKKNAEEIKVRFNVQCDYLAIDLAAPGSVQEIVDWCVKNGYVVSALVNNAGFGRAGQFEDAQSQEQKDMMQVNMVSPVLLCEAFIPLLRQQQKAYILNIASTTAYQAVPLMSLYAATKVFMLRFSRGLHEELRKTSISVTCVCPGTTDTDFAQRAQVNPKAREIAKNFSMSPQAVARSAVRGMLQRKKELVPGLVNKVGVFLVWLLPFDLSERAAHKIYR